MDCHWCCSSWQLTSGTLNLADPAYYFLHFMTSFLMGIIFSYSSYTHIQSSIQSKRKPINGNCTKVLFHLISVLDYKYSFIILYLFLVTLNRLLSAFTQYLHSTLTYIIPLHSILSTNSIVMNYKFI